MWSCELQWIHFVMQFLDYAGTKCYFLFLIGYYQLWVLSLLDSESLVHCCHLCFQFKYVLINVANDHIKSEIFLADVKCPLFDWRTNTTVCFYTYLNSDQNVRALTVTPSLCDEFCSYNYYKSADLFWCSSAVSGLFLFRNISLSIFPSDNHCHYYLTSGFSKRDRTRNPWFRFSQNIIYTQWKNSK